MNTGTTRQHEGCPSRESSAALQVAQRERICQNISVSVVTDILYLVSRLFLPPLILSHISLEAYGIWSVCFVLISYIGVPAIGVSSVYARFVSEYHTNGQTERINRLVTTCLYTTLLAGAVILLVLWFALPWILDLFEISKSLRGTAKVVIYTTSVAFVLDLTFGGMAYLLQGLQEFKRQKMIWTFSYLVEAALIVLLLQQGLGFYALPAAFAARYIRSGPLK